MCYLSRCQGGALTANICFPRSVIARTAQKIRRTQIIMGICPWFWSQSRHSFCLNVGSAYCPCTSSVKAILCLCLSVRKYLASPLSTWFIRSLGKQRIYNDCTPSFCQSVCPGREALLVCVIYTLRGKKHYSYWQHNNTRSTLSWTTRSVYTELFWTELKFLHITPRSV